MKFVDEFEVDFCFCWGRIIVCIFTILLSKIFNLSVISILSAQLFLLHNLCLKWDIFSKAQRENFWDFREMSKFSLQKVEAAPSTFKLCIANMNNFSWLNEKVMPLRVFREFLFASLTPKSNSSWALWCWVCVKNNAFSMPLKSTISHDTRLMKIYVQSESLFSSSSNTIDVEHDSACTTHNTTSSRKALKVAFEARDENKIIQILGEENLIICITTS